MVSSRRERENFRRESTRKKASENLKSRLAPFLSETGSWLESIRNAVAAGVSVQETVIENNADNKDGTAEYYYYGCSLAMVEIDSLRWGFYLILASHWLRYSTSDWLSDRNLLRVANRKFENSNRLWTLVTRSIWL